MDIINNIKWYLDNPIEAMVNGTMKHITSKQLREIVFDESFGKCVKICLPLNDDFLFTETRELTCPATVLDVLTLIHKFYKEPMKTENFENAFQENEEWRDSIIEYYDGDTTRLTNYDAFSDTCAIPDFCGLEFNEKTGEYFVSIGPE